MESTLAERKLHAIELIAKLDDEGMLTFIEEVLSAETGARWARLMKEAARLDNSVLPNSLSDDEIQDEVENLRSERHGSI